MTLCRTALFACLALTACASGAAEPPAAAPVPELHPTVRLDMPFTSTDEAPGVLLALEQPGVLTELQSNASALQACWEGRAPVARGGAIVIHAHLGADGLVEGQCVTQDGIGDPELLRCANDLVAMGHYPPLDTVPVDVVFTLHFQGGALGDGAC